MKEESELDSIKKMLSQWVTNIKFQNFSNDTGINRTSENLVLRLLNAMYDYNLTNLNWENNNYPAVDLGDREAGIAFQVTSSGTLSKIKETLSKFYAQNGPHIEFTKGLRFFFLKEDAPTVKADSARRLKKEYDFVHDQHMLSMRTILMRMEALYSEDRTRFYTIKKILEEEIHGMVPKREVDITPHKWGKQKVGGIHKFQQSEQPLDSFTIPPSFGSVIAHYFPEKNQLFLQFNLDDPESLEILKSLSNFKSKQAENKSNLSNTKPVSVQSAEERKLLGLLAVSTIPLKDFYFMKIFPNIDWNKQFKRFLCNGWLQQKESIICVPDEVKESLLSDSHEKKSFHQAWLDALEPIRHYSDIPYFLLLHYFVLKRFDDAIMGMADVIIDMEPSRENAIYLSILEEIAESPILNRINPESRVEFYNMMGLCLTRAGRHFESIKWFLKLRRYSKRIRHLWGIGQSYINCGVAYFDNDEVNKAERCYRIAAEHAKKTDDKWLLGRALHNLSMITASRDIDEAVKLIDESLKIKEEVDDKEGVASALLGYGNLAQEKGELRAALRWYQKAEKKAKAFNLIYLHSLTLINLGNVNNDLKNRQKAIDYFQRAKKMAEAEGYHDTLFLALKSESIVRFELEEFKKAEKLLRDLYELEKSDGDPQELLAALYNIGATLIKQNKYQEARGIFKQGLELANKNKDKEWIFCFHLTSAVSYAEAGNSGKTLLSLSNSAQIEEEQGQYIVAGQLWEEYIFFLIENNGKHEKIEQTFNKCIQCFEKADDNYPYLTKIYEYLALWRWDDGFAMEALSLLDELVKIAKNNKQRKDIIRFVNTKGVFLQELGMYEKAEKAHRNALKLALQSKDPEAIKPSLQNLGELFRKTHRLEESIKITEEAEKIAMELNDMEFLNIISYNRALTIRQSGKTQESEKILIQCKNISKKCNLRYEYVRALYGLSHNAQIEGKSKLAERRYLKSLREATINGFEEFRAKIAHDFSSFLKKEKRYTEAVEILKKNRDYLIKFFATSSYYISLANLYEDMMKMDLAKKSFEKAKKEAKRSGDQTSVSLCRNEIERIINNEKESKYTEGDFEKAIQDAYDLRTKALLMGDYASFLLSMDKENKAVQTLNTALDIVEKNGFYDLISKLHQIYGDYLWQKSPQLKYKALRVYFSGLMQTADNSDIYIEIGKHIIDQSLLIEPRKRQKQIQSFYKRLSYWLQNKFPMINPLFRTDYILWPLKVVLALPAIIGEEIPDHQIYTVSHKIFKKISDN